MSKKTKQRLGVVSTIQTFVELTKPGIIRANILTAAAGFLLASQGAIDIIRFTFALLGITGIIAGACVVNNIIDRKIDANMKRTRHRALVTKSISVSSAAIFSAILTIGGVIILQITSNHITALLGIIAWFWYVVLYGYAKRRNQHGTLIGAVPGALPLVAGYTAVTGQIDWVSFWLFTVMAAWQMPHFYAIALFRQKEYAVANIPVLPLVKGERRTKIEMILYTIVFIATGIGLYMSAELGVAFLTAFLIVGIQWLYFQMKGYWSKAPTAAWAKRVFGMSLLVLLCFCLLLSLDNVLP